MLALTLLYPGLVAYFARLEWGPMLTGYLGLLLMGATFLAMGLFASSLTENQIVAAIHLRRPARFLGDRLERGLRRRHVRTVPHSTSRSSSTSTASPAGVLDTKDVVYYRTSSPSPCS